MSEQLPNNSLAFIALVNEYCSALENAAETEVSDFIDSMIRLLPRLYISANDLPVETFGPSEYEIGQSLREEDYDRVRDDIARLLGEDDTYLEVFEEDMKYSDTPIGASIAEGLADLYQVFYDFLESVREVPAELIAEALTTVRESFAEYWSQTLTNVLRAVNAVKFK
ncbi:MAG: DUF5063 domain-containing protein [Muribaculaceae bacterium]|nr:DUF5063 domain-containing protein [Muribaculaceae bacterium]